MDDEQSVKANITAREPVEFPSAILPGEEPSRNARDLCLMLLQKNARKRLSARQALAHCWFRDPNNPTPHGNIDALNASIFDALAKYKSDNKLKRAVFQLYASEVSESEIQELCGKFMALDAQGDGLLSAEGLAEAARRVGRELPLEELREIVAALDASGQGRIGYKEFAAALVERGLGLDEMRLQECFRKFDGSGSGHISYEDVNKVLCSGDATTPAITQSEWEEIIDPAKEIGDAENAQGGHSHKDSRDGSKSSSVEESLQAHPPVATKELTLEAFMTLMLSKEIEKEPSDSHSMNEHASTDSASRQKGVMVSTALPEAPEAPAGDSATLTHDETVSEKLGTLRRPNQSSESLFAARLHGSSDSLMKCQGDMPLQGEQEEKVTIVV
jgi:Ca2+-binding EF-hand superfamily protein